MNRCGSENLPGHRHDGACMSQYRNGMNIAVHIQRSSTAVNHAGEEINVQSLRKPYLDLASVDAGMLRCGDRRYHKGRTELVLVLHAVSFPILRITVVHRQNQRNILCVSAMVHRVKIRNQAVAQAQEIRHNCTDLHGITPGLLTHKLTLTAVETVDG